MEKMDDKKTKPNVEKDLRMALSALDSASAKLKTCLKSYNMEEGNENENEDEGDDMKENKDTEKSKKAY